MVQAIDPKTQQRVAFAKSLQLHAVLKEGSAPLVQNAGHIQVALQRDEGSTITSVSNLNFRTLGSSRVTGTRCVSVEVMSLFRCVRVRLLVLMHDVLRQVRHGTKPPSQHYYGG
jgi:hypothetical protein